ncbi:hypothetical protein KI387_023433, partial [Taxus chinensis]
VHCFYKFGSLMGYLAINYLDRFLSMYKLPREDARFIFDAHTIQRMELLILSTLEWRMCYATPFSFVDCFASCAIESSNAPPGALIGRVVQFILSTVKGIPNPFTLFYSCNKTYPLIAITSPNYAQSCLCLDELSLMLKTSAKIICVFYGEYPGDLQKLRNGGGAYVDTFKELEAKMTSNKRRYKPDRLQQWKEELYKANDIFGWICIQRLLTDSTGVNDPVTWHTSWRANAGRVLPTGR